MSPSTVDTLLLASLRRIGDGCIHCGEAATQLAKPTCSCPWCDLDAPPTDWDGEEAK